MSLKTRFMLATALSAFFLLAGCALNVPANEQMGNTDMTFSRFNNLADPSCLEIDDPQPCYCMMCKNNTNFFARLKNFLLPWYDITLVDGRCEFEKCNEEEFINKTLNNESFPRVFMVGNGPSFASTGMANLYCNYSLQLATKWVVSSPSRAPRMPNIARAVCWLDRDALPLYIYYSNKTRMDAAYFQEMAQIFEDGNAGPAILTTEILLNGSDDVSAIHAQIDALGTCDKCLTVLAVKSGDMHAIERVIGPPPADPTQDSTNPYYDKVDLIGFGFRANDYPTCSIDDAIGQNYLFSRDILRTYFKPTIWLYAGASEGNSSDGSCTWSAAKVRNFYQNLFALSSDLAASGVIGMSMYEFIDRTGPLPCNGIQGCDFGVLYPSGEQKHPALNTWSQMCQYFGTSSYRTPLMFSRNAYGDKCELFYNSKMYNVVSTEINTQVGVEMAQGEVLPLEKIANLNCGEVCVSETKLSSESAGIYDNFAGQVFSSDHCPLYPMIEEIADSADISSTFVRSIIEHESHFDPSLPSFCVPLARPCNNQRPTTPEDTRNYYYMSEICDAAGIPPADCHSECPSGQKRCAFGLMQCIELPGHLYVQDGIAMPQVVQECGGENYNPFNPEMSICCGVSKFATALSSAEQFIGSNWGQIGTGVCDGGIKDEDRGWAAYYLASNKYFGLQPPSISGFIHQRDNSSACSGEENYIRYVRNRPNPNPGEGQGYAYGAEVISIYADAVDKCDSDCPGK